MKLPFILVWGIRSGAALLRLHYRDLFSHGQIAVVLHGADFVHQLLIFLNGAGWSAWSPQVLLVLIVYGLCVRVRLLWMLLHRFVDIFIIFSCFALVMCFRVLEESHMVHLSWRLLLLCCCNSINQKVFPALVALVICVFIATCCTILIVESLHTVEAISWVEETPIATYTVLTDWAMLFFRRTRDATEIFVHHGGCVVHQMAQTIFLRLFQVG